MPVRVGGVRSKPTFVSNLRTIFIVDDDGDFVALLTEILTQAGYEVLSSTQPAAALQTLQTRSFDMIVLDQKMGELSGSDFLTKLRQKDAATPVIVVSGYLESASAQEFINRGVSGIFFKPLNIFALLKRVEEIFKGSVKPSGAATADAGIRGLTQMPFASVASKEVFVKKLQTLSDFKGNLLLVGDATSPFEVIASEIVKKSGGKFITWEKSMVTPTVLVQAIGGATQATLLVKDVAALGDEERAAIMKSEKHEAPFNEVASVRFIFCLKEELDVLYEKKIVDDEFYLFLGNLELKIPRAANVQNLHKPDGVQRAAGTLQTATPFKAGGRVLVLDDEDLHAQMVVDLLEQAGHQAVKINNPSEALILLRKEKFSLIITDFRMPGLNGVDFIAQTRQVDASIPIFIVTGNIEVPEMVRIGNMGVTRLIHKPINAAKFLEEVAAVARP